MNRNKLTIVILTLITLFAISACSESDKSKIAGTMREYVESNLAEGERFDFIGLSNRRDTTFMGCRRPCTGVIYTITDNVSGEKTRHFADVIFSDDYKTALSVTELDFDPINYVMEKVRDTFKEKLREKTSR